MNLLRLTTLLGVLVCFADNVRAAIVFSQYSAYHHIQVLDQGGFRTLSFNGSQETRMSLTNSLAGHFEYTEYFHVPWLWNSNVKRVLMLGLGGGSTQRSFQHYYTNVVVDTVELDPVVISVAKKFFGVTETSQHKIHTSDGRVFLRRTPHRYDVILMDAYATSRYGSTLPQHLTTKEFFTQCSERLSDNGVLAYNVIGQIQGWRENLLGALFRTMKEVFPQVYMFPAGESQNVVLVATKSPERFDRTQVREQASELVQAGKIKLPTFSARLDSFMDTPPPAAARSPILTDDYAPVESLLRGTR